MTRPCADRLTVTSKNDRLTVSSRIIAALLSCTLLTAPVWAASSFRLEPLFMPIAPTLAQGRHPLAPQFSAATDSAPNNPEASKSAREPPPAPLQCEQRHSLRMTPARPQR